ncbi:MAG: methyltransferase domain-containing protein [Methylohalobius sp.]
MSFAELKARIAQEALRLALAEEPWPHLEPHRGAWHRHDFLGLPAERFVLKAYRALLGREADPDGLASYLPQCRSWLGRVAVLGHLAQSQEGRLAGAKVEGVRWWRYGYLVLRRLPGAGVWLKLADWLLRLIDTAPFQERLGFLSDRFEELEERLADQRQTLEAQLADQRQAFGRLERTCAWLQESLAQTERRLAALLEPPEASRRLQEQEALDGFYLAFEDACRGPELEIRQKLLGYLPLLEPARGKPIVDLGCGRGEWLKLLDEHGFSALGIETSPAMIAHCLQQGLNVVAADALAWLEAQAKDSLGAVTAFHLLEHLPFAELLALVQAAYRALQAGGVAIFETPNPENVLVGSHTFYHDPTHRHPLTPTLLEFVLRYAGFKTVRIERLNPYPPEARVPGDGTLVERVNGHFYGPQDFAAIGIK